MIYMKASSYLVSMKVGLKFKTGHRVCDLEYNLAIYTHTISDIK